MPIPLVLLFLILLGLSGGLATEEPKDSNEPTGSVLGVSSEDKTQISRTTRTITGFYIATQPALNIEDDSAYVGGLVALPEGEEAVVFGVYGYNLEAMRDLTIGYSHYEDIPETKSEKAEAFMLDKRAEGQAEYKRRVSSLVSDTTYYFRVCVEREVNGITCGEVKSFVTNSRSGSGDFRQPSVSVGKADHISGDSAVISGSVNMRDAVDGIVFLVYGESEFLVEAVEDRAGYRDIREAEEDLQRVQVDAYIRGSAKYAKEIDDLRPLRTIYYRMCVDYGGEEEGLVCSGVKDFDTVRKSRHILPYAETNSAVVGYNQVTLNGLIQMNDYIDGIAFFVVGSDKKSIDNVATKDEFSDIRQNEYKLQKVLLDDDADKDQSYAKTINFLISDIYYYRICVEYNLEDGSREEPVLKCGAVRSFSL